MSSFSGSFLLFLHDFILCTDRETHDLMVFYLRNCSKPMKEYRNRFENLNIKNRCSLKSELYHNQLILTARDNSILDNYRGIRNKTPPPSIKNPPLRFLEDLRKNKNPPRLFWSSDFQKSKSARSAAENFGVFWH